MHNFLCLHPSIDPVHYIVLLSAAVDDSAAMTVGVLFGGVAIGVVAILLIQGIVCGVYKLRKWKTQPMSTETDPTAENKSVMCTYYMCIM